MFELDEIRFLIKPTVIFSADETYLFAREPQIRRMPDQSLLCLIYTGGNGEPHPDNMAAYVRSEDDGETWSKPVPLWKHKHRSTWPTELCTLGEKPFMIFSTFDYPTHYNEIKSWISETDDSGKTWTEPQNLRGVPGNFRAMQCKKLSDGSWILPVYWCECTNSWDFYRGDPPTGKDVDWRFVTGMLKSSNQGKDWTLYGALRTDGDCWEPDVAELENGHLRAFLRSYNPQKLLWTADSYDYGMTWSEPKLSDIPNPDTKVACFDVDGSTVLFLDVNDPDPYEKTVEGLSDRRHLEAWVSRDHCATWCKKIRLADVLGENKLQVSYPNGFKDDEKQIFYLAIDTVKKYYLMKIPYSLFR